MAPDIISFAYVDAKNAPQQYKKKNTNSEAFQTSISTYKAQQINGQQDIANKKREALSNYRDSIASGQQRLNAIDNQITYLNNKLSGLSPETQPSAIQKIKDQISGLQEQRKNRFWRHRNSSGKI